MAAAHSARKAGYTKMDGYSPFPIEELDEALGFKKSWLPAFVLIGRFDGHCSRIRTAILGLGD